jgi:plasmid maintenance system killer protein
MRDIRDVYTYPWFDSKKKQWEWKDHRWIRLNKQRRVLFRQDKTTDPISIVIVYVSNEHYKK